MNDIEPYAKKKVIILNGSKSCDNIKCISQKSKQIKNRDKKLKIVLYKLNTEV